MEIITLKSVPRVAIVGRLSDGSDREEIRTVVWEVVAKQDNARYYGEIVQDNEPAQEQISDAIANGFFTDVTSDLDLIDKLTDDNNSLRAEMDDIYIILADIMFG